MNTLVKITLGLAAAVAGTLALTVLRKRKDAVQLRCSTPDGMQYLNGKMDFSDNTGTDHSSREIKSEKPENHFITDAAHSSHPDASIPNHYKENVKNVPYHQRGIRHR